MNHNSPENPVNNEDPQPAEPPKKRAVSLCISKNGQIIVRDETPGAEPRKTLQLPLNINGDPRLFVKNGELVRPFVVFEFKLRKTMDISGIDVSLYHEQSMAEFDPTNLVPIGVRSLDKDFEELNASKG